MIYITATLIFMAGMATGAWLFMDCRQRSPLQIRRTKNGWEASDLAGLAASVLIQKMPRIYPEVIMETDKTVVFKHPRPRHPVHYLLVPKKDIRNIGDFSSEDQAYLVDLFATLADVVKRLNVRNYRVLTNGPGRQDVAYLHLHFWVD